MSALLYVLFAVLAFVVLLPSVLAVFAFGSLWSLKPRSCAYWVLVVAPSSMLIKLLAWVLAPLLALISLALGPVLPKPLSYFHTHDNTLDGGQLQGWPAYSNVFDKWKGRVSWILRNPAYGYMNDVVGHTMVGAEIFLPGSNLIFFATPAGSGVGFNRSYDGEGISARGFFGPFSVWFGWKLERGSSNSLNEKRVMAAIGVKLK